MTSRASRTIVDATVRHAPDLEAGAHTREETEPNPISVEEISLSLPKLFERGSDRRHAPRTKLDEITYIGMGPENGGLVLDVSDGGLSFQSVVPVKQAESIRFLLSLRDESRIEGVGEVVWTNQARTLCGLKFTSLASDARAHLISWTNASRTAATAYKNPLSSSPTTSAYFRDAAATPASRANSSAHAVFAIPPSSAGFTPAAANRPPGPLLTWMMFGILSATFAVASYRYGVHVGELHSSSAAPAATDTPNAPASTGSAGLPLSSLQNSASAIPNAASSSASGPENAAITGAVSEGRSQQPATISGARGAAASEAQLRTVGGESDLTAALANLNPKNGDRDSAKAVRHLWSAVTNGNTEAEVILSGLYIAGDGVAKNCEQGRVLLTAAAKNGNAEARVKLDELNTTGCE